MPPSPNRTPTRNVLHERSNSQKNVLAAVRLVPYTPPRLQGDRDELYSRTVLPTHPAHFFPPPTGASYLGSGVASEQHVSANIYPPKSEAPSGPSVTSTQQPYQSDQSRPSTATSTSSRRLPQKRKHVALNPDNKTFRVLDVEPADVSQTEDGLRSPSSVGSSSLYDRLSFGSHSIDAPTRSSASTFPESNTATSPHSQGRASLAPTPTAATTNSPWNYQLVGGLRKVPKTPDLKQKAVSSLESSFPPLPEASDESEPRRELSPKPSFQSSGDLSLKSASSNYKVYGSSPSPYYPVRDPPSSSDSNQHSSGHELPNLQSLDRPDLAPPSSSDSNYQILGYSSQAPSDIGITIENFQPHGDQSPAPSENFRPSPAGPSYSRESLIIAPLRPKSRRSAEKFGYYKSRSRESLRRTGSLASISTVLSQEVAQAATSSGPTNSSSPINSVTVSDLWAPPAGLNSARFHMQSYPHQWSSQLSTVPSESDTGTDRGSRSLSDGTGRRGSGFLSSNSRQMASNGSLIMEEEHNSPISLERLQAAHLRSPSILLEDEGEHGDEITDMQDLRLRPSRTRLSELYSITSEIGRTYTMRSSNSSRTNSLVSSSIPTWARLYYGSGERRYIGLLGAPGSSVDGSDSRPQSSLRTGSPDTSNFPLSIYSPRRRPREVTATTRLQSSNRENSMDIAPVSERGTEGVLYYKNSFRRLRPSSSILSPHLKRDKRAFKDSKFFLEPPSAVWSAEGNMFSSRRKRLILTFAVGFVFPLAWIVGAFLPLPPNPAKAVSDADQTDSDLKMARAIARELGPTDETRYESANWWRKLNRGMAILGILLIVVIITLAVVSVKQGWAR